MACNYNSNSNYGYGNVTPEKMFQHHMMVKDSEWSVVPQYLQSEYDRGHSAGRVTATALGVVAAAGVAWWLIKKLDDRND